MMKLHESKAIISIALPLIAAFFAQKGMQFIDTFMMGWIGPEALAAGALGVSIYFTLLFFCNGTLSSVGIFIARAKGADKPDDIKSSLQHGLLVTIILALPSMVFIWFAPYALFSMGENAMVVQSTILLLHTLVWGFPGYLLFLVLREYVAAFSITRAVMYTALISLPLNFILNYVLIYGKFGLPSMGIAGIGCTGTIVMWFMFLCLWIYCKRHPLLKNHLTFRGVEWRRAVIVDLLYIGIPSGIVFILESGLFLLAVILIGYFGVDALAAHQIAIQCASITYTIPLAIAMATAMKISHSVGSSEWEQVRHTAYSGIGIALIIAAVFAMVFIFMPEYLVKIFLGSHVTQYANVEKLASTFLMIAAIFQCFDGLQAVSIGALRGLKDTFVPMLISIGCYWILGLSAAYYLAFHTQLGAVGVWYGLTLGICSIGMILAYRLVRKLRTT